MKEIKDVLLSVFTDLRLKTLLIIQYVFATLFQLPELLEAGPDFIDSDFILGILFFPLLMSFVTILYSTPISYILSKVFKIDFHKSLIVLYWASILVTPALFYFLYF